MARLPSIILAAACVALSACSSEPKKTAMDSPEQVTMRPPDVKAVPVAAPLQVETIEQKTARVIQELASKSIYFDYDDFSIKPEYQGLIKQDFELLMSTPNVPIILEGNADERGSAEYNLALGQKRAESVKRTLKMLGVPEARLEAISYGKEKPRAACHEEKCWAENRRVDLASRKPVAAN